jgi:rRNA maturation endonuclease Nob1
MSFKFIKPKVDPIDVQFQNFYIKSVKKISIKEARLCSDCDTIFSQADLCPCCANSQFMYISTIVDPPSVAN